MKKVFAYIALSLSIISCETVIDYEIPREDPQISMDTRIIAGDSVEALIGVSEYVLSSKDPSLDSTSRVFLYENGVRVARLLPKLIMNGSDDQYYYSTPFIPQEGRTYKLEAIRPGFKTASGQTVLKGSVDIRDVDFDGPNQKLDFSFDDPAGKGDYYIVSAEFYSFSFEERTNVTISTSDPAIVFITGYEGDVFDQSEERWGTYGYISDEFFDGGSKRVRIGFPDGFPTVPDSVFVNLTRITDEYYLHEKSKAASLNSDGFFSEPVQVYTNVENGYGIVTGGSPRRYKIFP